MALLDLVGKVREDGTLEPLKTDLREELEDAGDAKKVVLRPVEVVEAREPVGGPLDAWTLAVNETHAVKVEHHLEALDGARDENGVVADRERLVPRQRRGLEVDADLAQREEPLDKVMVVFETKVIAPPVLVDVLDQVAVGPRGDLVAEEPEVVAKARAARLCVGRKAHAPRGSQSRPGTRGNRRNRPDHPFCFF